METEQLIIKFEGENDIYLDTLASSLNATIDSLKIIADQALSENDFCKFKVVNIQKGSFEVVIQTIQEIAPQLLVVIPAANSVLNIFNTIWEIRKHLKGEVPKSIEHIENQVKIENNDGTIQIFNHAVFNIYAKNPSIEKELANLSKAVSDDTLRNGLNLTYIDNAGEKADVSIPKDELRLLSNPIDVESFSNDTTENIMVTDVTVHKPDLIGDSKWNLFLNNSRITAEIEDKYFLNRVRAGDILFSGNTKMNVTLVSRFKSTTEGLPEPNTKATYRITKVHRVEQNGHVIEID